MEVRAAAFAWLVAGERQSRHRNFSLVERRRLELADNPDHQLCERS
jgi:hypothetical protein